MSTSLGVAGSFPRDLTRARAHLALGGRSAALVATERAHPRARAAWRSNSMVSRCERKVVARFSRWELTSE